MCLKIIASEDFASLNIATCRPAWDVTMTFLDKLTIATESKRNCLIQPQTGNTRLKRTEVRKTLNTMH